MRISDMRKTIFIYALTDPETGFVRYIGKSVSPKRRFRAHLSDKSRTYRTNWICGLATRGLSPNLVILEEVHVAEGSSTEIQWIAHFGHVGLVNGTNGGDGAGIGNQIWSGRRHSEESKHKMSLAQKGQQPFLGHTHSTFSRWKMSQAKIKWWDNNSFSLDALRKIGESSSGRKTFLGRTHSVETRAKMSAAAKCRYAQQ